MRLPTVALVLLLAACAADGNVHRSAVVASVDEAYWIEADTVEFASRADLFDVYLGGRHVAVVEGAEQEGGRVQVWTEPGEDGTPLRPGARVELVPRTASELPLDRATAGVDSIPPREGPSPSGRKRRVLLLRFRIEPEHRE